MTRLLSVCCLFISLAWIFFATYKHIYQQHNNKPEYIFGQEDKELLIVQNIQQIETLIAQFDLKSSAIIELLNQLNWQFIERIYLSKEREHVFIVSKDILTSNSVNQLFGDSNHLILLPKQAISYKKISGKYMKNTLYLSERIFQENKKPWNHLQFDQNSDAVRLTFQENKWTITDIYIKKNGAIEYRTEQNDTFYGQKVNDKELFASIIPTNIESYQFYETDYLRKTKPELLNSPINRWIKYGLIRLTLEGHTALITDYIESLDPILILNEFYQIPNADSADFYFYKDSYLTSLLPASEGFFIGQINGFVIISADLSTCKMIIADYKMGNTLIHKIDELELIYGGLPQKVNFRAVNSEQKSAFSIYRKTLLSTFVQAQQKTNKKEEKIKPISYFVGQQIDDLILVDHERFFVHTTSNKIVFFDRNNILWEQSLNEQPIARSSLIDLYGNKNNHLLVATENKIFLFDQKGKQAQGFPVSIEDKNVAPPLFYRWKGNGFFVFTLPNGRLKWCDQQGRELSIISTKLTKITDKPVVWVSANKPFIGVFNQDTFEMIQAETQKHYRSFGAKNTQLILKEPNEIKLVGITNNRLYAMNQKGILLWEQKIGTAHTLSIDQPNLGIVIRDKQNLQFLNSNGIPWTSISLPFSELSDFQLVKTVDGKIHFVALDEIENKLYVWKINGEQTHLYDGGKFIRYYDGYLYSIVDDLVVRYSLGD